MKKVLFVLAAVMAFAVSGKAQMGSDRLSLGVGCLYRNGLDVTLSYEHEGKYHHAWEFFCQRLYPMGRMCLLRSYLPGIVLEELQKLRVRCRLQALRGTRTEPLRQCPYRSVGRQRHQTLFGRHTPRL